MEVILLEKIGKLGDLGDKVKVKAGYARNFLLPFGKAVGVTKANIAEFEARRAELEKVAGERLSVAEVRAEQLGELEVTLAAHAGEGGRLFGSVGAKDIVDAVNGAGIELKKNEIKMPGGPIREIGEYDVKVQLHTDIFAVLAVIVIAD